MIKKKENTEHFQSSEFLLLSFQSQVLIISLKLILTLKAILSSYFIQVESHGIFYFLFFSISLKFILVFAELHSSFSLLCSVPLCAYTINYRFLRASPNFVSGKSTPQFISVAFRR